MKFPVRARIFMAVGLLLLSASIVLTFFFPGMHHFLNGFLKGIALVFICFGFIQLRRIKQGSARNC